MPNRALTLLGLLTALSGTSCSGDAPDPPELPPTTLGDSAEVEVLRDITLNDDVRIPENDIALADVSVDRDRIVFRYEGDPSIQLEASQVVVGVLDGGYMRRITDVATAPDGTIVAQTEHATLLDVIADGHFRIIVSSEEIITMEDLMDGGVGMGSEPLRSGGEFPIFPPSSSGDPGPCEGMISGEFWFEPALTYNRELTFEVDISWFRMVGFRFIVDNALRMSFTTGARAALEAACSVDLIAVINRRREMAGLGEFRIERFTNIQLGPIPVVLTHTFTPIFEMGLELNINAEASFDAFAQAGARLGIEWNPDDGVSFVFEPLNDAGAELTTEAVATLQAGVTRAGLSYQLKLYDAIGPTLTLTGSLLGHAEADLAACEWTTWAELGGNFNLRGSVELPIVDIEVFSVEHDWPFPTVEFARSSGPIPAGCTPSDGGMMMTDGGMTMTDGGMMMTDAGPPMSDAGPPMSDAGTDGGVTVGPGNTSCWALLQTTPTLPDGLYTIDPDGPGVGVAPFNVYCDMTTAGGGWTLIDNDADTTFGGFFTSRDPGANTNPSVTRGSYLPAYDWSILPQVLCVVSDYTGTEAPPGSGHSYVILDALTPTAREYPTRTTTVGPDTGSNWAIAVTNGNTNRGTISYTYTSGLNIGALWVGSSSQPTCACSYTGASGAVGSGLGMWMPSDSSTCSTWVR